MKFDLKCPKDWELFTMYLADKVDESKEYTVEVKQVRDNRTDQQRKAIQLYCSLMSKALNDGGYSFSDFAVHINEKGNSLPWDEQGNLFKDQAWRLVQRPLTGHESTTKINTQQVTQIYDVLNQKFIDMTNGVSIEFPNRWYGLGYE